MESKTSILNTKHLRAVKKTSHILINVLAACQGSKVLLRTRHSGLAELFTMWSIFTISGRNASLQRILEGYR